MIHRLSQGLGKSARFANPLGEKEISMCKTATLLAACLVAGCAGPPVGDALLGPEKLAQQDDAYCRSNRSRGTELHELSAVGDPAEGRAPYGEARHRGWSAVCHLHHDRPHDNLQLIPRHGRTISRQRAPNPA